MAIESKYYVHNSDKAALKALKAIPGFPQLLKAYMKIFSERQYKIINMSSNIKLGKDQLSKYYDMLPLICEKLGIEVPELYIEMDVYPNAYTSGDNKPFIVMTSGLLETLTEDLIPTVLAHECGHIACHHVLYSTMGRIILGNASNAAKSYLPFGGLISFPIAIAFYYWMRCSELSADRAAVICDGNADMVTEMCMRFAGFDKDINEVANREAFMNQAKEYRNMVNDSKWDKALEFLTMYSNDHPLSAVRALEATEWSESDQFKQIMDGAFISAVPDDIEADGDEETAVEKKTKSHKFGIELPKFGAKQGSQDTQADSVDPIEEIRRYKALLDDGIISEAEFAEKKRQLLGL